MADLDIREAVAQGYVRRLVTGSRDWRDADAIWRRLYQHWDRSRLLVIMHGDQMSEDPDTKDKWGADYFAKIWALNLAHLGVIEDPHPADWRRYGSAAGPIRNEEMVRIGADDCLAFPLGVSKGTRGCMALADAARIPVFNYGDR